MQNPSINDIIDVMIEGSCFNVTVDSFRKIKETLETDYPNYELYHLGLKTGLVFVEIMRKDEE